MERLSRRRIALGLALVLCLAALDSAAAATEVYLPQALRGNSQNTTRILVWNTGTTAASFTLEFFDQSGARQETQTRTLEPDATEEVLLGGPTVALTVGWVKVTSIQDVRVTAFFRLKGLPEVGVLPVKEATDWAGVGEVSGTWKTGLAAANPGSVASTCELKAYLANGQIAGEADVLLGPGDQIAGFLDELIPDLPTPFQGCFSLRCEGSDIAPLALRQSSDGAFTTVAMSNSQGFTKVYFPQAVRGDSQNTTRILIWNNGSAAASVKVVFSDQNGASPETRIVPSGSMPPRK